MNKPDSLIRTKLHVPFTRPELVPRKRLQEHIALGLHGPLTLITAPAGFGKTTLLASCIHTLGMPIAWLSLDKDDNQIEHFLSYLVAAFQDTGHQVGEQAAQLLVAQPPIPQAVMTSLINDLDETGKEVVLVLDDYHAINSLDVHSVISFLLEHCPRSLHILISSRSDPPVPLTRLRGRGQVIELRGNDLRFTKAEAMQYLNDIMNLGLDDKSVAALEERTEGWIAGLQMAALSMRNRADVDEFIKGFSGTNRYILDYLLEEVLASQPPDIQHFLLCTSILERLTATLCAAVLEAGRSENSNDSGPAVNFQSSDSLDCQAVLEGLERANLFLVPLDEERQWFRYHHLFADLLRTRLDQLYPGFARQCHTKAATWFEGEGMMVEAVNHTLAAREYDRAARLVEENTTRLLAQGEMKALMGWIAMLPSELRLSRPWLCVHQAYALSFAGRMSEVPPLLNQAEAILKSAASQESVTLSDGVHHATIPTTTGSESLSPGDSRQLGGSIAALRAMTAVMMGQDVEAIPHALHARELLPETSLNDRTAVAWALGYAMHSQGRLDEASAAFKEQIQLGRMMNHPWAVLAGRTYLAQVLLSQGQLHQAQIMLNEALAEASKQGASSRGYMAFVEANLAQVLYEHNDLQGATRLLSDALAIIHQWPNPNFLVFTHALLARVLLARGNLHEARRSIGEADQVSESAALTRLDKRWLEADLVRVWLGMSSSGEKLTPGDPLEVQANTILSAWQSELASQVAGITPSVDKCTEIAALTLARVLLARGELESALTLLGPVTRAARVAGHTGATIDSLVLTALVLQGGESANVQTTAQTIPSFKALEEALSLARPRGYVRTFLDEGQPMMDLLARWLSVTSDSPHNDYVVFLLSEFNGEPKKSWMEQEKVRTGGDSLPSLNQSLVEPLSERELEVLQLMALGRNNPQIARQLVVAPGTIKAHAASIYRKLDVANRTEAVARARQLKILI